MIQVNVTEFIAENDLRSFFPKTNEVGLKKIDGPTAAASAYMHNSGNWFVHDKDEAEQLAYHLKYFGIAEIQDSSRIEELNALLATEIAREYVSHTYFGEELEHLERADDGEWVYVF